MDLPTPDTADTIELRRDGAAGPSRASGSARVGRTARGTARVDLADDVTLDLMSFDTGD